MPHLTIAYVTGYSEKDIGMMDQTPTATYPGTATSIPEIMDLAAQYHQAAAVLVLNAEQVGGPGPVRYGPARFCAIHAVELCLNAFLRLEGAPPKAVRARMHNLADDRFVTTIGLRRKTAQHLHSLTAQREYLIARYAPDLLAQQSQLNRMMATLVEVQAKTHAFVNRPANRAKILDLSRRAAALP